MRAGNLFSPLHYSERSEMSAASQTFPAALPCETGLKSDSGIQPKKKKRKQNGQSEVNNSVFESLLLS